MSWVPTGTNNVPLGRRGRMPDGKEGEQEQPQFGNMNGDTLSMPPPQPPALNEFSPQSAVERARAIANSLLGVSASIAPSQPLSVPGYSGVPLPEQAVDDKGEPKRRRKNRWGDKEATALVSAPPALTGTMSKEQLESYAAVVRINEITRKLKSGEVVPPDGQRSPSPAPIYNSEGKRTNTREHRYRRRLEDERTRLVEERTRQDPDYRPPADYKRRSKFSDKVFIPVDDNPGLNFIGLLIGPRGNTLKKIEGDSGTKISIRGRGSIKEGKRRDDAQIPGADEELHCHIIADSEEKVRRGVRIVREIIQKACVTPEGHNDLKRNQLRELAALNGTLRDDEGQACTNCGALGHRRWECPEQTNVTLSLVCRVCGGKGHVARDCNQRHDPAALQQARERDQQLNSEYLSLMAELGEAVPANGLDSGPAAVRLPNAAAGSESVSLSASASAPAPWLRDNKSPASEHRSESRPGRSRSPRPLPPPTTPPWLRRPPPSQYYNRGPPHPVGPLPARSLPMPRQRPPRQNASNEYAPPPLPDSWAAAPAHGQPSPYAHSLANGAGSEAYDHHQAAAAPSYGRQMQQFHPNGYPDQPYQNMPPPPPPMFEPPPPPPASPPPPPPASPPPPPPPE